MLGRAPVEELVHFQVAFVITVWATVISAATDKNRLTVNNKARTVV